MDGSVTIKMDHNQTKLVTARASVQHIKKMDHDEECHTSKEYFECHSLGSIDAYNKTIDDFDLQSPLVQSFKSITDAELSIKRPSLHNSEYRNSKSNRSTHKILRGHVYQEPLYPKLCLQQLSSFKPHSQDHIFDPRQMIQHSTPVNNDKKTNSRGVTPTDLSIDPRGFFAEDFYDRKYLCFIQNVNCYNYQMAMYLKYILKQMCIWAAFFLSLRDLFLDAVYRINNYYLY